MPIIESRAVADKITRQVNKFKEKQISSSKNASIRTEVAPETEEETTEV
jgi:ribosome-associated translation inhibitor RaiA